MPYSQKGIGVRFTQACYLTLHGACKGRRCDCDCHDPRTELGNKYSEVNNTRKVIKLI